jgi:hypothetical protein
MTKLVQVQVEFVQQTGVLKHFFLQISDLSIVSKSMADSIIELL